MKKICMIVAAGFTVLLFSLSVYAEDNFCQKSSRPKQPVFGLIHLYQETQTAYLNVCNDSKQPQQIVMGFCDEKGELLLKETRKISPFQCASLKVDGDLLKQKKTNMEEEKAKESLEDKIDEKKEEQGTVAVKEPQEEEKEEAIQEEQKEVSVEEEENKEQEEAKSKEEQSAIKKENKEKSDTVTVEEPQKENSKEKIRENQNESNMNVQDTLLKLRPFISNPRRPLSLMFISSLDICDEEKKQCFSINPSPKISH